MKAPVQFDKPIQPQKGHNHENTHTQNLLAAALVGLLLVSATAAGADETNPWSFDVVPYLWVAGIDVETSLPSLQRSTAAGVDRFDTSISAGAMLAARARYRSVGLFVDFAWLRLDTEALNPGPEFSAADLQSDLIHATVAL